MAKLLDAIDYAPTHDVLLFLLALMAGLVVIDRWVEARWP